MPIINEEYKTPIIIAAIIVVALLVYGVMTMRDNRNASDRISDTFHELEDRASGQKLNDVIKDAGDEIKESVQPLNKP